MKHCKRFLLTIAAAGVLAVSGCGGTPYKTQPPGSFLETNLDEDFALSCDDIWSQSENAKSKLKYYRSGTVSLQDKDAIRDYGARLRVLHRWGQKKGCEEQWGLGSFSPDQTLQGQQAPAPREKSRVIICNDDQTCVVE